MVLPEVLVYAQAARDWPAEGDDRRRVRRTRDSRGRIVHIGDWRPDDWNGLLSIYRSMAPARRPRGMPAAGEEREAVWLDELLRRSVSVVARLDGLVVGHAALIERDLDAVAAGHAGSAGAPGRERTDVFVCVRREYDDAGIDDALRAVLSRIVCRQDDAGGERTVRPMRRVLARLRRLLRGRRARSPAPRVAHS